MPPVTRSGGLGKRPWLAYKEPGDQHFLFGKSHWASQSICNLAQKTHILTYTSAQLHMT